MPAFEGGAVLLGSVWRFRRALLVMVLALTLAADSHGRWAEGAAPVPRVVAGWLPYWATERSVASFRAQHDLFSEVSPFWYQARGATDLRTHAGGYSPDALQSLRKPGVAVLPSVTETLDASEMARLLGDRHARHAHVSALAELVSANGFDGIDLDYERMNFGGTEREKAAVREGYVTLVRELAAVLHANGKLLSVTVGARRARDDRNWAVHDYAGIGAHVDRLRIMTYDYHTLGSAPGPIAPLGWVEEVVAFAVSQVPAGKVQVGVPTYGYDWPVPTSGTCPVRGSDRPKSKALTTRKVMRLVQAKGLTPRWDPEHAERTFSYPDPRSYEGTGPDGGWVTCRVRRVVWYPDAESTRRKAELVGKYGLRGMAFWTVGGEDHAQWAHLRHAAQALRAGHRAARGPDAQP